MATFLDALRAELAKPAYAGTTDAQALAILNGPGNPAVVTRTIVPSHEVFEAIVPAAFAALDADTKARINAMLAMGQVNVAGTNTRAAFAAAFPLGATRTALLALTTVSTPRTVAQEFLGTSVGLGDIATARQV